jgi:hydroxymethylglutaryl-CoA synthase
VSGIVSAGAHVPYRRLDRTAIAAVAGTGGGRGHRAVSSYDEDTSTMAVEAARTALGATATRPDLLLHATAAPPYLDKTNATVVHAALRLGDEVGAWDVGASVRSATGALRMALERPGTSLVTVADIRVGLPGGAEESAGGDAGAALLVAGPGTDAPLIAEYLGGATVAAEFIDRWRTPGAVASRTWEERFGELQYVDAGLRAWKALDLAGMGVEAVDALVVAGLHGRACTTFGRRLAEVAAPADDLAATIGNPGVAQPSLLLTTALQTADPGSVIALVVLADGADVFLFRTTDAVATNRPERTVAIQIAAGGPIAYGRYLAWRGLLTPEPPRRPEPARVSAPAAARNEVWKLGLSSDQGGDLAGQRGTVATFTVDRLAWSPSPPVIFAVVDFPDGARLPVELTDVDEGEVEIGSEVDMVFRRLGTADGIHNYFWKGRLVR